MSSKTIVPEPEILNQITEEQVCLWITTKLAEARKTMPAHNINYSVHYFERRDKGEYCADWGMHAADKCVVSKATIGDCIVDLAYELADRPGERIAEIRRKARQLLKEADAIESTIKIEPATI